MSRSGDDPDKKPSESGWREDLGSLLDPSKTRQTETREPELGRFIRECVLPAFQELSDELERYGRTVVVRDSLTSAALIVSKGGEEEMSYRVQGRTFPTGVLPYAEVRFRERKGRRLIRVESMFRSGKPNYTLFDVTTEEIIRNFLDQYKRRVQAD